MFDSVVFASWPRGLYLAKRLSEEGNRVAYVEILPRLKNPFGLFVSEDSKEEKDFLESLGFLFRQEGGFCLLSPEGIWSFQDMKEMINKHSVLKNQWSKDSSKDFKHNWLAYLSLNLAGKVFDYNNSEFSEQSLNFFSDYFLFEWSLKKIQQFQKDHPKISFYQVPFDTLSFQKRQCYFSVQKETLKGEEYFWLDRNTFPCLKNKTAREAHWQWEACFFAVDFGDYGDIIPPHFVSLKQPLLPWSHDNLLSVFHKINQLEVWVRKPYKKKIELKGVKEHLETVFESCVFTAIKNKSLKGPLIYGKESLDFPSQIVKNKLYIGDVGDFFQMDLLSELCAEKKLFNGL